MSTPIGSFLVRPAPWLKFSKPLPSRAWDIRFTGVAAVTATMVLTASPAPTPTEVGVGIAVILIMLVGYFSFARRGMLPDNSGLPLQIFLIGATAAGCLFSSNLIWFQLFLYPAIWISSNTVRQALIANATIFVTVSTAYITGVLARGHVTRSDMIVHFAFQLLGLLESLGFGLWMAWLFFYGFERQTILSKVAAAQTKLEAMSREEGAEEEQKRIARDIHDAIAQSLVSQVILAQKLQRELSATGSPALETAGLMEEIANEALRETRLLIASNTNPAAATTSLNDAIALLIVRFERETGIVVTQSIDLEIEDALPRELEIVVIRVVQEGLANVRKHSGASTVSVSVDLTSTAVTVEVRDDGIGLRRAPVESASAGSNYGLVAMRERVSLVGGTINLTAPGSIERPGTALHVKLPISREAANS